MVFSRSASVLRALGKTLSCRSFATIEVQSRVGFIRNARQIGTGIPVQQTETSGDVRLKNVQPETSVFLKSHQSLSELERKTTEAVEVRSDELEAFENDENAWNESYIYEDVKMPGALDHCTEDLSDIGPNFVSTFNFAAYANKAPVIQEFVKLGVDLHQVEKRPQAMQLILQHDFAHFKPYVQFLHDCGVPSTNLGAFLTKNPMILAQNVDDLRTRIRYLRAHNFTAEMVARIVSTNPFWLMFSTERIDNRLGYFQTEFKLNGSEVRRLATKQPRLVTYRFHGIRENTFAVREEMGFDPKQTKDILLSKPRIFMKSRKKLVDVFDFVHNTMKLSHPTIAKEPKILTCRIERLRHRHGYLVAVGKAQYDPTKPMYVSPEALISGTDVEFAMNVAKTTVNTYNMYLKNL